MLKGKRKFQHARVFLFICHMIKDCALLKTKDRKKYKTFGCVIYSHSLALSLSLTSFLHTLVIFYLSVFGLSYFLP